MVTTEQRIDRVFSDEDRTRRAQQYATDSGRSMDDGLSLERAARGNLEMAFAERRPYALGRLRRIEQASKGVYNSFDVFLLSTGQQPRRRPPR